MLKFPMIMYGVIEVIIFEQPFTDNFFFFSPWTDRVQGSPSVSIQSRL